MWEYSIIWDQSTSKILASSVVLTNTNPVFVSETLDELRDLFPERKYELFRTLKNGESKDSIGERRD